MNPPTPQSAKPSNFRRFFLRGLGVLLPTILTIWILVAIYQFVDQQIASPLNSGVREIVLSASPWPEADPDFVIEPPQAQAKLDPDSMKAWVESGRSPEWLERRARRLTLEKHWKKASIGTWQALDLIGFVLAVVLIYTVGFLLGGFIGRGIFKRLEAMIRQIPVVKAIYPSVKQVTDFFFADDADATLRFDRVVAVEYPRKGVWSVGLVTGGTMNTIQVRAGTRCVTVFIPSSPTPFTGYTITVSVEDIIDLPVSIDDALRFTVSGGVVVPPSEIRSAGEPAPELTQDTPGEDAGS